MAEQEKLKSKDSKRDDSFKGKRYPKKGNRRFKRDEEVPHTEIGGPGNDVAWWIKETSLISNAANLKSNWIAGRQIDAGGFPYIPKGVVKYEMMSTYGNNVAATDPINVWARDLYLRMFQKYRGITSYTAADLGITLLAGIEVVKLIAKYERIYGVINRYSRINVNMPTAEVEALGLTQTDAEYLRTHLSDFRYDLNVLIKKAQRLCVLKDMSIIADSLSLLGYEYLDHDNTKAQIIIFDTEGYFYYDDGQTFSGGALIHDSFGGWHELFDLGSDNMCDALNFALSQLVGSDSVQKIYGDLVVWFGEDAMLQILPITDDYIVTPVYSESILHKMHNMHVTGDVIIRATENSGMSAADVSALEALSEPCFYQFNDVIHTRLSACGSSGNAWETRSDGRVYTSTNNTIISDYLSVDTGASAVLDTYRVDVDTETIVEGVLFKFLGFYSSGAQKYSYVFDTCDFWLIKSITLYGMNTNGTVQSAFIPSNFTSGVDTYLKDAGTLAILDWAPLTYRTLNRVGYAIGGDLDTPVPLPYNTLLRLQEAIFYSGLRTDVPVVSK